MGENQKIPEGSTLIMEDNSKKEILFYGTIHVIGGLYILCSATVLIRPHLFNLWHLAMVPIGAGVLTNGLLYIVKYIKSLTA